ncbi:unnamed protein product [Ectocarpus sp. CCAP 1310/34]|nr:unnamed protein product [Ectocarpus sp. CCAP 1310/34]
MDEESIMAGAAAAASSLQNIMHTFDSDGEHNDQEPGGSFGDLLVEEEVEEEEEEREKHIRRSYPRPEYWRSTWGKWVLKLRELNAAEERLDPECREAVQFAGTFRIPFVLFESIMQTVTSIFPSSARDVAGRDCPPVELKVCRLM